jgi:ABC-type amino acid transport substrate-binding protein
MKIVVRNLFVLTVFALVLPQTVSAGEDLPQVKERGSLRHLGIPYANFNTGAGDGLSVELVKLFAEQLGVKYEYVPTQWSDIIADLTGKKVKPKGAEIEITGTAEIKGDIIANGFTVLPWREKAVSFSTKTFPTQVWLVASSDSKLNPIVPTGDVSKDIEETRKLIKGLTVLGKAATCLDPALYDIAKAGATEKCFDGGLNDLAPALLKGEADVLLLDVPDCLVALRKWPGKIKVLGPMSEQQHMAAAFRQDAPELRQAFEEFLAKCKQDGTYLRLIRKYYPDVFIYYPEFFRDCKDADNIEEKGLKKAG